MKKLFYLALITLMITFSSSFNTFATESTDQTASQTSIDIIDGEARHRPSDEAAPVAKIDNETYTSLEDALSSAESGSTITLLTDLSAEQTFTIDRSLTLDGHDHKLTSTLSGSSPAFLVTTSDPVTITNLDLTSNARGITVDTDVHHLTLKNLTLTVADRGFTANADNNHSSTLLIEDSLIQNSKVEDYDHEVPNGDLRGLSLWQYSDSEIILRNTTIQGFTYVININPDNFESSNATLLIDGCTLKGRANLNIWTAGFDITIKNSELIGINNFSGPSESFANIVINQPAQASLNIIDTKFINYQNDTGLKNENALQYALSLRSSGNHVTLSGNTSVIDTTGKLEHLFEPQSNQDSQSNQISITGGTYDFDISDYLPSGYQVILQNGNYIIAQDSPAIINNPKDTPDAPATPDDKTPDGSANNSPASSDSDSPESPNTGLLARLDPSYASTITCTSFIILLSSITYAIYLISRRHKSLPTKS